MFCLKHSEHCYRKGGQRRDGAVLSKADSLLCLETHAQSSSPQLTFWGRAGCAGVKKHAKPPIYIRGIQMAPSLTFSSYSSSFL